MLDRITSFLQDFFSVSPKEARGVAGLLLLSAMVLLFPVFLKRYLLYRTPAERAEERVFLDSLLRAVSAEKKNEPGEREEELQPAAEFVRLRDFNPNTASADEMISLGIPAFLARRITNYRQKGGVFRRKEDLRHIYDFPDDLYQKMTPYIRIPAGNMPGPDTAGIRNKPGPAEQNDVVSGRERKRPTAFEPGYSQAVIVPFDINKADTVQLKRLKGIGSGRARIIVNYRNALGGFHSENQYPEIYGLDSISRSELKRYARILSPPRKIAINSVLLDELLSHPYARKHRRASEAVIRYREQHGAYRTREDLEKIVNITPAFLDLLGPYLSFD